MAICDSSQMWSISVGVNLQKMLWFLALMSILTIHLTAGSLIATSTARHKWKRSQNNDINWFVVSIAYFLFAFVAELSKYLDLTLFLQVFAGYYFYFCLSSRKLLSLYTMLNSRNFWVHCTIALMHLQFPVHGTVRGLVEKEWRDMTTAARTGRLRDWTTLRTSRNLPLKRQLPRTFRRRSSHI
jgi:hypothetical protein